jgi:hypothetical protein
MAVPLYGFETWSSAIRKGHRLTVFDNGMLRNRLKMGQREGERKNKRRTERITLSRGLYNLHPFTK